MHLSIFSLLTKLPASEDLANKPPDFYVETINGPFNFRFSKDC